MSQIVRVEKTKNYTVMGNWHLRDKNLSLKAKGFLSLVLSLPEDWFYSKQGLRSLIKEGETVLDSVLKELKSAGYFQVNKLTSDKTESGRFEYEYIFYERKQIDETTSQDPEKPNLEKPDPENLGLENLDMENHPLYKYTNISNTKKLNTNKKELEFEFEEVWKLYPNKKGKSSALKAYLKARKSGTTKECIVQGIRAYTQYISLNRTPKQYILHGSTWFNQRRWEDDNTGENPNDEIPPARRREESASTQFGHFMGL